MKKSIFYIALSAILFSSMEVALKAVSGQFNAIQMTCTRFLVGGIVLIPFALHALRQRGLHLTGSFLKRSLLLGLMNVVVSMTLYQLAVQNANASVVAVLFSSNPIFVTLFAFLLLHEEIHKNQVAALLLQLTAILVIINPTHMQAGLLGILLTLAAVVTFALYSVLAKRGCVEYGSIVTTCGSFLCGSAEMLLLILLSWAEPVASLLGRVGLSSFARIPMLSGYTLQDFPVFLYICIGVTGAGFVCYFKAMETSSTAMASLVFFFKPMLAPIFALLFLRESITPEMAAGIVLMLAGSLAALVPGLLQTRRQQAVSIEPPEAS